MKNRNHERARLAVVLTAAFLIYGLIWQWPSPARGQQSVDPKRVLVLSWYSKDYLWNVEFDQSFKSRLDSAPPGSIEYYQEYLESNRFPGERQASLLRDYLRKKYANHPIDVVVATSDASLEFLIKDRSSLFPGLPIVFVTTQYPTTAETTSEPGLTGIINISTHRRTVDLALSLHPATEEVFVVSGTLEHDQRLERLARQELQGYEGRVQITYLTDLSSAQLIEKMKSLPKRSIVLYVWEQSKTEQGKLLESVDLFDLVSPHMHVPIYGMLLPLVGRGVVGGYINTGDAAGTKIAEIVLRIATGTRAVDIPVERAPAEPIFDWRELRHWGIRENELPRDSLIRFREVTLWDQYGWRILGVVVLFLGLLWGLYQLRLRQVAREFNVRTEERVNERMRIARDLHDTMLQSFQGAVMHFQVVADLISERPQEAKQKLDSALDLADQAITEGRDTVQGLRSSTTVTNDIAAAMVTLGKELAATETNHNCPEFRVDVVGVARDLHPITRDELCRIAGEAVRNAFKHAQASRIEVEIQYDPRRLRLRIRDDGRGIESSAAGDKGRPGHYGLPGMRERAKLIGGNLELWSKVHAGTEIELTIPAAAAYAKSAGEQRARFFRKGAGAD